MSIPFNFRIASVDNEAGVMEIHYSSVGYSDQIIFGRLPEENETVESVVLTYAPIAVWYDETAARVTVTEGYEGSYNPETDVSYDEKRRAEYPDVMLYIDGIVKGDQKQVDDYIAECLVVKNKYPKDV